jgi:PEP-CTERM motif
MKLRATLLLFATLCFLMMAPAWSQDVCQTWAGNQIVNCGFETGDFTGWGQYGDTSFTFVDGNPYSGNYAAWFGPVNGTGDIYQFVGAPGQTEYWVHFELANLFGGNNFMTVYWNGIDVGPDFVNAPAFGYTEFYGVLPGNPCVGCNEIDLQFYQPPSYWNLDSVYVGTPEPGTLMLFGSGILGLAGLFRRKLNL